MTPRTRRAGFTLIEVLAVVLLTSIVIGRRPQPLRGPLPRDRARHRAHPRHPPLHGHPRPRGPRFREHGAGRQEPEVRPPLPPLDLPGASPTLGDRGGPPQVRDARPPAAAHGGARVGPRGRGLHAAPRRRGVTSSCCAGPRRDCPRASTARSPTTRARAPCCWPTACRLRGAPSSTSSASRARAGTPSQLIESSELPLAVEIERGAARSRGRPGRRADTPYSRRVLLPVRPLDLRGAARPEQPGERRRGERDRRRRARDGEEGEEEDERELGARSQALLRRTVRPHDRVPGHQLPGEDRALRASRSTACSRPR